MKRRGHALCKFCAWETSYLLNWSWVPCKVILQSQCSSSELAGPSSQPMFILYSCHEDLDFSIDKINSTELPSFKIIINRGQLAQRETLRFVKILSSIEGSKHAIHWKSYIENFFKVQLISIRFDEASKRWRSCNLVNAIRDDCSQSNLSVQKGT